MKISNERAPKVAEQKGPKTAQSGELDVLKTLQTLVKPAGPAADPVLSALQALTGVQAPTPAAATATTAKASFDASARQAAPTRPLLPNSVSPPDNDRLFRCFQDAWKSAYGNTRLASTGEREALMKLAGELRTQGKSAVEIEYTLLAHIKGGGAASGAGGTTPVGANPAEVRSAAKEAFKSIFGREPTPELTDWANKAQAMAQDGKDATTIKYALMTPMQQARDKVDPNDRNALNTLARDAFKSVFGREPSSTELTDWANKAQAMAQDGKDATTIKYSLITPMQEQRDGGGKTDDNALRDLIKTAFREVLRDAYRDPSPNEEKEWMQIAQKLRDEGKLSATAIKHMLISEVRTAFGNL
ncbi:hypothetical protein ACLESO_29015 [Pyxidicoccus sp. 3LG]